MGESSGISIGHCVYQSVRNPRSLDHPAHLNALDRLPIQVVQRVFSLPLLTPTAPFKCLCHARVAPVHTEADYLSGSRSGETGQLFALRSRCVSRASQTRAA